MRIQLSERTRELIMQYFVLSDPQSLGVNLSFFAQDEAALFRWFFSEIIDSTASNQKELEYQHTLVRVALLGDLSCSMGIAQHDLKQPLPPPSLSDLWKFYLIAVSGTLVAACEGFDGISTLLSVLPLPSIASLLVGLTCSALSVMVFYGFNLVQVSKNLGIKLTDAANLLDLYVAQMKAIQSIHQQISAYKLAKLTTEELEELVQIIQILEQSLGSLTTASTKFSEALNSPKMQVMKAIFSGVSGVLFFGSGFFAGQTVATSILSLLFVGMTPASWPVILFSCGIGLAAFSLYWYVEKVGLDQLVSGWFGLDEEKIDVLCNEDNLNRQRQELINLKEQIDSTADIKRELELLKQQREEQTLTKQGALALEQTSPRFANSMYSFHRSVHTLSRHPRDTGPSQDECLIDVPVQSSLCG